MINIDTSVTLVFFLTFFKTTLCDYYLVTSNERSYLVQTEGNNEPGTDLTKSEVGSDYTDKENSSMLKKCSRNEMGLLKQKQYLSCAKSLEIRCEGGCIREAFNRKKIWTLSKQ